ncbi:MAG: hypothetical protein NW223_15085 [Hyphomicrobiaceae bacterium]|nr:hypothetical protein [Hyphomicrobiaceae bacterium]
MPDRDIVTGRDLLQALRGGRLPGMVDWFDPIVLGMVAVRTLISTTIGEYADQRPMQEAADGEQDDARLVARHDYSKRDPNVPSLIVPPDADSSNPNCVASSDNAHDVALHERRLARRLHTADGGFWVDFVADLGDGFEATYAVASLLAAPELSVATGSRSKPLTLPAGQILIFGGDLAYPNATAEEYRNRCLNPYSWAFTADRNKREPSRELFFIAGNHDWYDGLSAFTTQFCYEATSVGGWRCRQERSYFALRLPDDWWIWGIDVALGDSIDVGQLHYFQKVAHSITRAQNAKIVLILHAPDWTKPTYKALMKICEVARQCGEICAIIAGDLHHYSRYEALGETEAAKAKCEFRAAPLQLIVSGGGGAFAHPTHDQKPTLDIDPMVAGRSCLDAGSFKLAESSEGKYRFRARKFYPSQMTSRLLAFKNLLLPFHNVRFAVLVGLIYFIYAWVFHGAAPPDHLPASTGLTDLNVADAAAVARAARASPAFFCLLLGLWIGLIAYTDVKLVSRAWSWLTGPVKVLIGSLHFSYHIKALLLIDAITSTVMVNYLNPSLGLAWLDAKIGLTARGVPLAGREALEGMRACSDQFRWAATNTWTCVVDQPDAIFIALSSLLYAGLSVLVGGIVGAFIFGCYWVLTSALFRMHQDAFSALAIKDYKNFLRMKVEKDQLTIYPIALDEVPGRMDWRETKPDEHPQQRPLIVPKTPMRPRLIEAPIVIKRADVPPYAQMVALEQDATKVA